MVAMCRPQTDRLNMLLTDCGQSWADQLPRLLEPQGVRTLRAGCVNHAIRIIQAGPIHMAVVDLALPDRPDEAPSPTGRPGGLRLLEQIRHLESRPQAVVVVRDRQFDRRIDDPVLLEAMRLDAFSVLDQPVELEQILSVLRRALDRYYNGQWPGQADSQP